MLGVTTVRVTWHADMPSPGSAALQRRVNIGVGLGIALWRDSRAKAFGAVVNGGALLLHGLVMVLALGKILG